MKPALQRRLRAARKPVAAESLTPSGNVKIGGMSALPFRNSIKPPHDREAVQESVSHLDKGLTVKGHIESDGAVYIHGYVWGRIDAERVVIGWGGAVDGDIVARDVQINGRLNGRIFAHNVTLNSEAEVTGRIFHNTVTVEKGARIDARMPWRPLNYFDSLQQLPETRP